MFAGQTDSNWFKYNHTMKNSKLQIDQNYTILKLWLHKNITKN